jgi:hypothetical protein
MGDKLRRYLEEMALNIADSADKVRREEMINEAHLIYLAGRAEGVRECVEAVKNFEYRHRNDLMEGCYSHQETFEKIIAALEGVRGEK